MRAASITMESLLSQPRKLDAIVRSVTSAYPEVEGIYLYGSTAREESSQESDVDVAVVLPGASARTAGSLALSDLRFRLEDVLRHPVDLVNARAAPVVLQKEIIATGIPIYTGDPTGLQRYEMIVLSLYGKLNEERRGILEDFASTGRAYRP
jgi:uncharacterized protein